jgi:AcrR family transcriptional regulator
LPKTLTDADIEVFRERLCDVAEALFAAHGPDGVTLRQLAEALGVSSMTPYRYFKDRDAILAAVRTRAFNRFAEAMEEARDQMEKAGRTRSARDGEPGNAYLDFARGAPNAYRMMFDVNQPTATNYPELVAAMDRARATMGAGLRGLAAQGRFKGDAELAAHAYWSAMHGAVMLQLAGLLQPPLDAHAIARPALEALSQMYGFMPRKSE